MNELLAAVSSVDSGDFNEVMSRGMTPGLSPDVVMASIISDPRIAKLLSELESLASADRSRLLDREWSSKFDDYKRQWMEAIEYEGEILPAYRYGLEAMLYLSVMSDEEARFLRYSDEWLLWYSRQRDAHKEFKQFAKPDVLLMANLYALTLAERGNPITGVRELVSGIRDNAQKQLFPTLEEISVKAWSDDLKKPAKTVVIFPRWGKSRTIWGTKVGSDVDQINAILRARSLVAPDILSEARQAFDQTYSEILKSLGLSN